MSIVSARSSTHRVMLCGLFAALIAMGAFIQIPVPYLDYFTLQFLFVVLAGLLLGARTGALSVTVYVLLGLFGVPIFAAGGGFSYVLRPSFGYLLGFIAGAWVAGWVSARLRGRGYSTWLISALTALVVVYAIGISYKYLILNLYLGQPTGLWVLWLSCFPLDLPGDLVLCFASAYVAQKLQRALYRG